MNRQTFDLQISQPLRVDPCDDPSVTSPRRLVVVIQRAAQDALLASRILALAQARSLDILLLGVSGDASESAELRRQLVTIAAFIREEQARMGPAFLRGSVNPPEIQVEAGRGWLSRIRSIVQVDDVVACYLQPRLSLLQRPLDELLGSALNHSIYVFETPDTYRYGRGTLFAQAAAWLGSLAAIAGFVLLEIRIVPVIAGWVQTVLLLILLGVEITWIWFLNSLSGPF